jgi:hypothetical protein
MALTILPAKVLRVISFFGYKCDKEMGLKLLDQAVSIKGIRSPIAALLYVFRWIINP